MRQSESNGIRVHFRLFILGMVGVSIAWVPVIKETNRGQVFIYIQEVTNYLAPPFAAIYLLAVLVPMVNETVNARLILLASSPFFIGRDGLLVRAPDSHRKVASSNPGRSGGRMFFSRVNFLC